ncbi:MAG: hypothetical protein V1827_00460 [Candidatus Micrarchaeota archaeon]
MNIIILKLAQEDTILKALRKRFPTVGFKKYDVSMEIEDEGRKLVVIDTVKGVGNVTLLTDLHFVSPGRAIEGSGAIMTLRILKSIGSIDSTKVIAVPEGYTAEATVKEMAPIIAGLLK